MILLWHSDPFRPKKLFSSPKNSDFFIWSQISHLVNFVIFEAAKYFLGQNRSEFLPKFIGDQKNKFGPPLALYKFFLKIQFFGLVLPKMWSEKKILQTLWVLYLDWQLGQTH